VLYEYYHTGLNCSHALTTQFLLVQFNLAVKCIIATILSAPVVYGKGGKEPKPPKAEKQPKPLKATKKPVCPKKKKNCGPPTSQPTGKPTSKPTPSCTSIITDGNKAAAVADWTSNGTGGAYCHISNWDTSRVTIMTSKSKRCLFLINKVS
jgi:hypothetical protein